MSDADIKTKYSGRNFTEAEMEILLKLERLELTVSALKESSEKYISRVEFEPVRRLVDGMVGVILLAFLGAVVALVIGQ